MLVGPTRPSAPRQTISFPVQAGCVKGRFHNPDVGLCKELESPLGLSRGEFDASKTRLFASRRDVVSSHARIIRHQDGSNQLADEPGTPAGAAPYADYTGFVPVNPDILGAAVGFGNAICFVLAASVPPFRARSARVEGIPQASGTGARVQRRARGFPEGDSRVLGRPAAGVAEGSQLYRSALTDPTLPNFNPARTPASSSGMRPR